MTILGKLRHVRCRRRELASHFDVARQFEQIEETCVPSYLHRNLLASGVAWWRLFAAESLYLRFAPKGKVLDFGAATGELGHLLPVDAEYEFVEVDTNMARTLEADRPAAIRRSLEHLEPGQYAAVFALDSLEHNEDVASIAQRLIASLRNDGVLIVSGPTENFLYQAGRRIARFDGHYHKTTIHNIERILARSASLRHRHFVPFGIPLFSISCWAGK